MACVSIVGTFGTPGCPIGLVAKPSTAWLAMFGLFAVLWASAAEARTAALGIRPASVSGAAISIETATGESIDLVSIEAFSVVIGPLIATKLEFDFAPIAGAAELRVRFPPRAAVLESDNAQFCNVDIPPSFVAGTWTKQLGFGNSHFALIYAQPLDRGRAVVVSSAGHPRLTRLGATLNDDEGRELAAPLVLTNEQAAGDVVAELEVDGEAYRAGDLAIIKVNPEGERTPVPVHDAVVAIDTSASSAKEFPHLIEQARWVTNAIQGKLALIAFDQSAETLFSGASKDLPESVFERLAQRGALGATNLESAFPAIEALARKREFQRVILLTDGVATAGVRDRASLSSFVARWAQLGVRRLDVVAPDFGRNQSLLEALVTTGLAEHGRVASTSDDFVRELEQSSVPDLTISIPEAIVQSPWTLVSPFPGDERWILARVPKGVALSVRVGNRAPQILSAQPAWRPLFERYFEQQGPFVSRSNEAKHGTIVLEHGKLSIVHMGSKAILRCSSDCFVSGRLPPESVQRIVRLNFGRFRGCAVRDKQAPIVPKGRVTVRFVIDLDGQVTSVRDVGSSVPDRGFVRCVMEAFTALRFAPPPAGPVTVVYPLVFGDAEGASKPNDDNSQSYSDDIPKDYVPVTLANPEYPLLPRDVGTEAYEGAFLTVMQAIAAKQLDDADRATRGFLERQPSALLAHLARGRVAEARGNTAQARRAYGSLLDRFPASARIHRVAAAWLSHLGDRSSRALAVDALRTAIQLNDARADSERELAWILVQEGAYEAALDLLTAAFLHLDDRSPSLLNQEIAILASTLLARHPERRAWVIMQLKRTGTPLLSNPKLVFALQNESARGLALAIYANPERGRLRAIPYSNWPHTTAYEVAAAERQAPYAVHVVDRESSSSIADRTVSLGYVRILDYDGRGRLRVELRPFVLQMQGSEVDLLNYK